MRLSKYFLVITFMSTFGFFHTQFKGILKIRVFLFGKRSIKLRRDISNRKEKEKNKEMKKVYMQKNEVWNNIFFFFGCGRGVGKKV